MEIDELDLDKPENLEDAKEEYYRIINIRKLEDEIKEDKIELSASIICELIMTLACIYAALQNKFGDYIIAAAAFLCDVVLFKQTYNYSKRIKENKKELKEYSIK